MYYFFYRFAYVVFRDSDVETFIVVIKLYDSTTVVTKISIVKTSTARVLMMRMVTKIKLLTVMGVDDEDGDEDKTIDGDGVVEEKNIEKGVCVWGGGGVLKVKEKHKEPLLSQNFHDNFDHGEQTPTILILIIFYFSLYTLTFSRSVSP